MLKEKLVEDLKSAQKNHEREAVLVLRMILSEVKNAEIEKKEPLDEEETLNVILAQARKHEDSISQFKRGERADLVEKEEKELAILKRYLPEQLSEEEVRIEVAKAIAATRAQSAGDMGKVMGALMPKLKGRTSGNLLSSIVKEELGS